MRFALLGLVAACGSSPPTTRPGPTLPATDPETTAPAPVESVLSAEFEHPTSRRDMSPPPNEDTPAPEIRVMEGVRGFWCIRHEQHADTPSRTNCYRSEATCREQRTLLSKKHFTVGACTRADQALCFDIEDRQNQATYYRCLGTRQECSALRAQFISDYPDLVFGACLTTARADTDSHAAPPAPRAPPAA